MSLFLLPESSKENMVFIPQELWEGTKGPGVKFTALQGGVDVALDPGKSGELQLGQTFASVRQITDSCFAISNTVFNPVTPKPDWYDGLNGKFNSVKRYANQWLDDYSIVVTSTIPNTVLTYSPIFSARAEYLLELLSSGSGDLTEADLATTRNVLTKMLDKSKPIYNEVKQYAHMENGKAVGKLIDWRNNMSAAGLELKSGTDSIQKAASKLQQEITEFNNEIDSLKLDIQYYQKLVATGAGLVGGGIFIGTIGGGLCFAFPVVGGIILALGIAAVIGGSAVWGVYQKKINDANSRIVTLNNKISENGKTVAALSTLSTSMDLAVENAENAIKNMTDFSASWLTFGKSLENLIHAIDDGRATSDRDDIQIELRTSMRYWNQAENYAQRLCEVPTNIEKHKASEVA